MAILCPNQIFYNNKCHVKYPGKIMLAEIISSFIFINLVMTVKFGEKARHSDILNALMTSLCLFATLNLSNFEEDSVLTQND